jgi:hypothetical protein
MVVLSVVINVFNIAQIVEKGFVMHAIPLDGHLIHKIIYVFHFVGMDY